MVPQHFWHGVAKFCEMWADVGVFMSSVITEDPADNILDVLPKNDSAMVWNERNRVFLDTTAQ